MRHPTRPKEWAVIYIPQETERKIADAVRSWAGARGSAAALGRVLIPLEKKKVRDPLRPSGFRTQSLRRFPGYLLLELEPSLRRPLSFFLRRTHYPAKLLAGRWLSPQDVAAALAPHVPAPPRTPPLGSLVRVEDGPFAGFTGTVQDLLAARAEAVVQLSLFGRETPIPIPLHSLSF